MADGRYRLKIRILLSGIATPKNKKPGRKPGFQNAIFFENYFVTEESFTTEEESDIIVEESATTAEESTEATATVSTVVVSSFFSPPQEARAKTEAIASKRIEFFIFFVFNVYTVIGK